MYTAICVSNLGIDSSTDLQGGHFFLIFDFYVIEFLSGVHQCTSHVIIITVINDVKLLPPVSQDILSKIVDIIK